jgi:hypothetical protein
VVFASLRPMRKSYISHRGDAEIALARS